MTAEQLELCDELRLRNPELAGELDEIITLFVGTMSPQHAATSIALMALEVRRRRERRERDHDTARPN